MSLVQHLLSISFGTPKTPTVLRQAHLTLHSSQPFLPTPG